MPLTCSTTVSLWFIYEINAFLLLNIKSTERVVPVDHCCLTKYVRLLLRRLLTLQTKHTRLPKSLFSANALKDISGETFAVPISSRHGDGIIPSDMSS